MYNGYIHGGPGGEPDNFSRLTISNWRQFQNVDIDLSSRLTVLTGENGAGKTTVLKVLGQHFDAFATFVGTPAFDDENFTFTAGKREPTVGSNLESIGQLRYRSGAESSVGLQSSPYGNTGIEFQVGFESQRNVPGLMMESRRFARGYQKVESVPPKFNDAAEIHRLYVEQIRNWMMPNVIRKSPGLMIKESLIAAAIYGEGNSSVTADPVAASVWEGFQNALRRLFPPSIGFDYLRVTRGEVILHSNSGAFALESMSGGLNAIFELAWEIYLYAHAHDSFTLCIDEPENHLHPSLQRSLIPGLLDAFPNVNLVVATHSPFVVTSDRSAKVYALSRTQGQGVTSRELDFEGQAYTSEEVLRDVLGVDSSLPVWAANVVRLAVQEFTQDDLSIEAFERLTARLNEAGVRFTLPDVYSTVAEAEEPRDA